MSPTTGKIGSTQGQASGPIRVGIVGLGPWGSRLLQALQACREFDVFGVCDADRRTLDQSHSAAPRFLRLQDLLREADVEAVVVAVPPQQQAALGLKVLEAGRHLFIEKPMATTSSDANRLVAAAHLADRVVCVGHVTRYQEAKLHASRLIQSGVLGPVRSVLCERVGARPRPGVTSWWVLGSHDMSFLLSVFPGPFRYSAVGRGAAGVTDATLELAGAVQANLRIVGPGDPARWTMVIGESTSLWVDERANRLYSIATPAGWQERWQSRGTVVPDELFAWARDALLRNSAEIQQFSGDALQDELAAFFRAVRFGEPLLTDAQDGQRVVDALEAAENWRGQDGDEVADALEAAQQ